MITFNKDECLKLFPSSRVFGTVITHKSKNKNNKNSPMSSIVLLMMGVARDINRAALWTDEVHDIAKKCKNNSLSSYSHYGLKGYVYSFGNKALYGYINGSSIAIYAGKKSEKKETENDIKKCCIY